MNLDNSKWKKLKERETQLMHFSGLGTYLWCRNVRFKLLLCQIQKRTVNLKADLHGTFTYLVLLHTGCFLKQHSNTADELLNTAE